MDFWDIDGSLKELGHSKSYCSVTIEWSPDGKYLLTGVLYERVKVDNEINIFKANG